VVGASVGANVGATVGAAAGLYVGLLLGGCVGAGVGPPGTTVGAGVGAVVRQEVAPIAVNPPLRHGKQFAFPVVGEYVLVPQREHEVAPEEGAELPAGHSVHPLSPRREYSPAGHVWTAVPPPVFARMPFICTLTENVVP
jgi:hypothetical protein